MHIVTLCVFIFIVMQAGAQQVGINNSTPDPSSALDIQSANKGLLIPRMTRSNRAAIPNPANGLMVYQSGPDSIGFYYFHNSWHYINYDSMLPPSAMVLSATYPNTRLENNRFSYNGMLSFPNATLSNIVPIADNIWQHLDSLVAGYPAKGAVDAFSIWADSVFFIAGGYVSGNTGIGFHKYNPVTQKWRAVEGISQLMPQGAAHARVGNKWIFWGGYYNPMNPVNTSAIAASIFDMNTLTMSQSAVPADSARSYHSATTIGSNIYFWGGAGITSPGYSYKTGYQYNVSANSWTPMSSAGAPEGRMWPGAVAAGTNLIVWGGRSPSSGFLNTGGIYNTLTNTWTTMSTVNAPPGCIDPAIAYYNNQVYVLSGTTAKRFDPVANTWTTLATLPFSFSGQKHAYDGNGKIFVWGSPRIFLIGTPVSNAGYIYDIPTNSYTSLSPENVPLARGGHIVSTNGNGIFMVWGGTTVTGVTAETTQTTKTGALFFKNASNVIVTQPLGNLYLYEKQ